MLLELLGEKEEAVDALTADLAEARDAYKAQLEELVSQLQQNGAAQ